MCTVTFVNASGKKIITSNRDEQVLRPNALQPEKYFVGNKSLIFPKDPKAGGTWYALDEAGNVAVLLNGADEKHQVAGTYRKSRGLILLDILSHFSPIAAWNEINLMNIEPFTLILFQENNLYQLRWNGNTKDQVNLDANKNYIWSSTTLYPKEIREERQRWFLDYTSSINGSSEKNMFHFHRYAKNENTENGLVINRNNFLKTLSITQTTIENRLVKMKHYDLAKDKEYQKSFNFVENKTN